MAVLTAAEARVYLPQLTGTAKDTVLSTLITRADAVLAQWLGYPPASAGGTPTLEAATHTLYIDGPGGQELSLPVRPIASVTSIHDSPARTYGAADLVASGDYTVFGEEGIVVLSSTAVHGAWTTGYRAIKVIASLGFTANTAPEPIKQAICLLVAHWFDLTHTRGQQSISQGGVSVTLAPDTIPASVKQLVAPYRNYTALLGA